MARMTAQSGTFSAASLAGNFAINWSGVNLVNGFEEDFVGVHSRFQRRFQQHQQWVFWTSPNWATAKSSPTSPVNGFLTLQGNGSLGGAQGNATAVDDLATSPSTTFNFRAYVIDNNTI